jgi:hypothetical protein
MVSIQGIPVNCVSDLAGWCGEPLSEVYADHVGWHQIAQLIQRSFPVRLAIRIAC